MTLIDFTGAVAGLLTTLSFVPQAIRVWRTRSAEDISLWMFLLFSLGVFLWLLYGIHLNAWPIIIANAVTLSLALSILFMKLRFDRQS